MIDKNIIEILIKAGKMPDSQSSQALLLLEQVRDQDEINRLHWKSWDEVTKLLSDDDLVALVKALTIVEKTFNWSGGSVSSVIWTFHELHRRKYEGEQVLAQWICDHNDNEYLPYGSIRLNKRYKIN